MLTWPNCGCSLMMRPRYTENSGDEPFPAASSFCSALAGSASQTSLWCRWNDSCPVLEGTVCWVQLWLRLAPGKGTPLGKRRWLALALLGTTRRGWLMGIPALGSYGLHPPQRLHCEWGLNSCVPTGCSRSLALRAAGGQLEHRQLCTQTRDGKCFN